MLDRTDGMVNKHQLGLLSYGLDIIIRHAQPLLFKACAGQCTPKGLSPNYCNNWLARRENLPGLKRFLLTVRGRGLLLHKRPMLPSLAKGSLVWYRNIKVPVTHLVYRSLQRSYLITDGCRIRRHSRKQRSRGNFPHGIIDSSTNRLLTYEDLDTGHTKYVNVKTNLLNWFKRFIQ